MRESRPAELGLFQIFSLFCSIRRKQPMFPTCQTCQPRGKLFQGASWGSESHPVLASSWAVPFSSSSQGQHSQFLCRMDAPSHAHVPRGKSQHIPELRTLQEKLLQEHHHPCGNGETEAQVTQGGCPWNIKVGRDLKNDPCHGQGNFQNPRLL